MWGKSFQSSSNGNSGSFGGFSSDYTRDNALHMESSDALELLSAYYGGCRNSQNPGVTTTEMAPKDLIYTNAEFVLGLLECVITRGTLEEKEQLASGLESCGMTQLRQSFQESINMVPSSQDNTDLAFRASVTCTV